MWWTTVVLLTACFWRTEKAKPRTYSHWLGPVRCTIAIPTTCDYNLTAATMTNNIFDTTAIYLDLELRWDVVWTLVVANVDKTIIGGDFISLVDWRYGRLLDSVTSLSSIETLKKCEISSVKPHSVIVSTTSCYKISQMLQGLKVSNVVS